MKLNTGQLLLFIAANSLIGNALATVPANSDASRIEGRVQDRLKPAIERNEAPDMSVPEPFKKPTRQARPSDNIRFTLRKVIIQGNTVLSDSDIAKIYRPFLGARFNLTAANQLAGQITQLYRSKGYVLSYAIVPPQNLNKGQLRLKVVEGYVRSVRFEGRNLDSDDIVRRMGNKITYSRPLHKSVLERYTSLMFDTPTQTVKAVFEPSKTTPGASDLIIKLVDDYYKAYAMSDNRGSEGVGEYEYLVGGNYDGLFGYDRVTANIFTVSPARELKFGSLKYERALGSEGWLASVSYDFARVDPGISTVRALGAIAYSRNLVFAVKYPWIRSSNFNLYYGADYGYRLAKTNSNNGVLFKDEIHSLKFHTAVTNTDKYGTTNLTAAVKVGVNGDNNNPTPSRTGGRTDYSKLELEVKRLNKMWYGLKILVGIKAQKAFDQLLSSEQFGVGGAAYGRAYDNSEISGDNGYAMSAEIQYPQFSIFGKNDLFQPYVFIDHGKILRIKARGTEENNESLSSAGAGLRINYTKHFSLSLEAAKPTQRNISKDNSKKMQYHFSFMANI